MALFQKDPFNTTENKPLYTLGLNAAVLIVGLGNPGKEYSGTRHNIGFECVDEFAEKNDLSWVNKKDLKCVMADINLAGTKVIAIKPTTFMNLSGEAVQAVANFYKIPDKKILVIHDELDITFGQIRNRIGGSAGGHNGVKSIIEIIGPEFNRIRVGIGPKMPESDLPAGKQVDSADFVLAKFPNEQSKHISKMKNEVNSIITEYIYGGELPKDTRTFLI